MANLPSPPSVTASSSVPATTAPLEIKAVSPLLYTVRDVQKLLQLGRNTVYELCNTPAPDGIRSVTVGQQKRVARVELERWIERRTLQSSGS